MRPLQRYILLQIPEAALIAAVAYWLASEEVISAVLAWVVTGLWIAKDVAFYPLMRHAYSQSPGRHVGREHLEGALVVVDEPLEPAGWVHLRGERWKAEASRGRLAAGDRARVLRVRDLTLVLGPPIEDTRDSS